MRVGEQLAYFARLHGLDGAAAARAAEHWADRLGLGERRRDQVEKLSLGNQQRVQLAAALVSRPEVLILDEPVSGLDPVGVDALAEALLEQVRGGVPVVFSSHQLDLVERLCDAVGILARGAMVATGPVAELRRREDRKSTRLNSSHAKYLVCRLLLEKNTETGCYDRYTTACQPRPITGMSAKPLRFSSSTTSRSVETTSELQ